MHADIEDDVIEDDVMTYQQKQPGLKVYTRELGWEGGKEELSGHNEGQSGKDT